MMKDPYLRPGNGIPDHIVKEYNKIINHERYLERKDRAHGLIYTNFDKLLEVIPDPDSIPISVEEEERRELYEARFICLPTVLKKLKEESKSDYQLIYDFYLAENRLTQKKIAAKYGLTLDAVRYRIHRATEKLKELIDSYINNI